MASEPDELTERLVESLEACERYYENHRTLTEVRIYGGPDVPPTTDPAEFSWDQIDDYFSLSQRIWCIRRGDQYRIESRSAGTSADPYAMSRQFSFAWDGHEGRETQTIDGIESSSFIITSRPGGPVQRDAIGTGQGWWVFNRGEPMTHVDILRDHLLDGPTEREDGQFSWLCAIPQSSSDDTVRYVARRIEEGVRLTGIEVVYRGERTNGGGVAPIVVEQTFWFDESSRWLGPNDHVPSRYISLVQPDCSQRAPGARCWALREHVVIEATPRPEDLEPLFRPQPLPGARVLDERLGVSFTMGGRVIVIDQRALQTDRPTDATVITELDRWIEAGQWVEPVGATRDAADDPSDDPEDLESTSHDPGGSDP